ncbi:unnamed protein product [Protopolystoma xenopodis]|uniref:Uncharacterized protein n=1 Tax=Protopolystoma xenopodis TaxID=117903 RepID=A0A448XFY7_9PLAT|nr:unnamed protein product [Protopolystoma xenopodis]
MKMTPTRRERRKRDDYAPRFIHVQPDVKAYTTASRDALGRMEGYIRQLASDPKLYITHELGEKIQALADQTAILKMDNFLMQGASGAWRNQFPMRQLVTEKQSLLSTAGKLEDSDGQLVRRFITNMTRGRIACTSEQCAREELSSGNSSCQGVGWTDSAVRSAHAWANQELSGLHFELEPLVDVARQRTTQYLDELGVTDRYLGYRANLGYSGRRAGLCYPNPAGRRIVDDGRSDVAPRWQMPIVWERANQVGTRGYQPEPDSEHELEGWSRGRSESAGQTAGAGGQNVESGDLYPSKSEYQTSYIQPFLHDAATIRNPPPGTHRHRLEQPADLRGRGNLAAFDSSMVHSKGYPINPKPNFLSHMREPSNQASTAAMASFANAKSEMKDSYSWSEMKKKGKGELSAPLSAHV